MSRYSLFYFFFCKFSILSLFIKGIFPLFPYYGFGFSYIFFIATQLCVAICILSCTCCSLFVWIQCNQRRSLICNICVLFVCLKLSPLLFIFFSLFHLLISYFVSCFLFIYFWMIYTKKQYAIFRTIRNRYDINYNFSSFTEEIHKGKVTQELLSV